MFDGVFQFPDVAGPIVCHENLEGLVAEAEDLSVLETIEAVHKVADQKRDVFPALGKRGEPEFDHIDPVKEVFAKDPFFHELLQVFV